MYSIRPTEQVKFHWTEQRARPEIQRVWVCKYTSVDENMVPFRHIYICAINQLSDLIGLQTGPERSVETSIVSRFSIIDTSMDSNEKHLF